MNLFKYSDDNKRYHTFNYYLKNKYQSKVAKVSLNAGLLVQIATVLKARAAVFFVAALVQVILPEISRIH